MGWLADHLSWIAPVVGTLVVAWVGAQIKARLDRLQWQRQQRMDAYVALLVQAQTLEARVSANVEWEIYAEGWDPPELEQGRADMAAISDAVVRIQLVGPRQVVEAAKGVQSATATFFSKAGLFGAYGLNDAEIGEMSTALGRVHQSCEEFAARARADLSQPPLQARPPEHKADGIESGDRVRRLSGWLIGLGRRLLHLRVDDSRDDGRFADGQAGSSGT